MDKTSVRTLKLSPEDQIKLDQYNNSKTKVDDEWMILAEFAKAYGWEAYRAARNDEISLSELLTLLECNRKLEALDLYRMAQASFIGAGSARAKRPSSAFKSLTRDILKRIRID